MVLSIIVHELLSKQSKYNLTQDDYKSLIPKYDIPDKKVEYHKSMETVEEKTIELDVKKSKKKVEEFIVTKDDEGKVEVDDFSFEEIIQIPDNADITNNGEESDEEEIMQFELDEEEEVEEGVEEEVEEGVEEEVEDDKDKKELPEEHLMLDLMNVIEEKNKKENKVDKEKSVEIEMNNDKVDVKVDKEIDVKEKDDKVDVKVDKVDVSQQEGGSVKRIILDQHYNFF
jgi:hypothetical protein